MANIIDYTKNVAKSIGYATVDKVKDMNPSLGQIMDDNKELSKNLYAAIKDYKGSIKKGKDWVVKTDVYEAADVGLHAIIDDIRSGKFYNRERISEMETRAGGAMTDWSDVMGGEDPFAEIDGTSSSSSSSTEDEGWTEEDTAMTISDSVDNTGQKITNGVALATAQSAQGINATNVKIAQKNQKHNEFLANKLSAGMGAIDATIGELINFNTQVQKPFVDTTTKFYNDIMAAHKETNDLLKQIVANQEKMIAPPEEKKEREDLSWGAIGSIPDLKTYLNRVKKNIKDQSMGMFDMFNSKENGGLGNMLLTFAASPLQVIPKMLVDAVIPKTVERASEALNTTIEGLFGGLVAKFNRWAEEGDNPILGWVGKILGIQDAGIDKLAPRVQGISKKAIAWDEQAKHALTRVIPDTLAKILAAQTKTAESIFDYNTGKYINLADLEEQFDYRKVVEKSAESALADIVEPLKEQMRLIDWGDDLNKFNEAMEAITDMAVNMYQTDKIVDPKKIAHMHNRDENFDLGRYLGITSTYDEDIINTIAAYMAASMDPQFRGMKEFDRMRNGIKLANRNIFDTKNRHKQEMKRLESEAGDVRMNLFNDYRGELSFDIDANGIPKVNKQGKVDAYNKKVKSLNWMGDVGLTSLAYQKDILKTLQDISITTEKIYDDMGTVTTTAAVPFGPPPPPGAGNGGQRLRPSQNKEYARYTEALKGYNRELDYIIDANDRVDQAIERQGEQVSNNAEKRAKEMGYLGALSHGQAAEMARNMADQQDKDKSYEHYFYNKMYGHISANAYYRENKRRMEEIRAKEERIKPLQEFYKFTEGESKIGQFIGGLKELSEKPGDFLVNMVHKVDDRLYEIVFGDKDDDKLAPKSFMNQLTTRMGYVFRNFTDVMKDEVFEPIREYLFGPKKDGEQGFFGNFRDKMLESLGTDKEHMDEAIKNFIFGTVDEKTGKRTGGMFGDKIQWTKDSMRDTYNDIAEYLIPTPDGGFGVNWDEYRKANYDKVNRAGAARKNQLINLNGAELGDDKNYADLMALIGLDSSKPETWRGSKKYTRLKEKLDDDEEFQRAYGQYQLMDPDFYSRVIDQRFVQQDKSIEKQNLMTDEKLYARIQTKYNSIKEKKIKLEQSMAQHRQIAKEFEEDKRNLINLKFGTNADNQTIEKMEKKIGSLKEDVNNLEKTILSLKRNIDKEIKALIRLIGDNGKLNDEFIEDLRNFLKIDIRDALRRNNIARFDTSVDDAADENRERGIDVLYKGGEVKRSGLVALSKGEIIIPNRFNPNYKGNKTNDFNRRKEEKAIDRYLSAAGIQLDKDGIPRSYKGIKQYYGGGYTGTGTKPGEAEIEEYDVQDGEIDPNTFRENRFSHMMKNLRAKREENKKGKRMNAIRKRNFNRLPEKYQELIKEYGYDGRYDELSDENKERFDQGLFTELLEDLLDSDEYEELKSALEDAGKKINSETYEESKERLFGAAVKDLKDNAGAYFAPALGSALVGGGVSLITGAIGGPLLGAAVGAGTSIINHSDKVKDWLFGELDENGNRKGNVISADLSNNIKKYLPDMAKGATAGAITSILPFVPGGPVSGIILGSALGFAKNNEKVQRTLFGYEDDDGYWHKGLLPKDFQKKLQGLVPAGVLGALGGALGGFIVGGPFGLVGNMALGSSMGMLLSTEKLQDALFGEKDPSTGIREGGLVGTLKEGFVKPLIENGKDLKDRLIDWFKRDVAHPVKEALAPMFKQGGLLIGSIGKGIANAVSSALTHEIGKGWTGLGHMFSDIVSKTGQAALNIGQVLARPTANMVSAPARLFGRVGERFKRNQVASGDADYMSAKQRMQYRQELDDNVYYEKYDKDVYDTINGQRVLVHQKGDVKVDDLGRPIKSKYNRKFRYLHNTLGRGKMRHHGKHRDRFETFDRMLMSIDDDEMEELAESLNYLKDSEGVSQKQRDKAADRINKAVHNDFGLSFRQSQSILRALREEGMGGAQNKIDEMFGDSETDQYKRMGLTNLLSSEKSMYDMASDNLEQQREKKNKVYQELRKLGIDIDPKNIDKFVTYADDELRLRKKKNPIDQLNDDQKARHKEIMDVFREAVDNLRAINDKDYKNELLKKYGKKNDAAATAQNSIFGSAFSSMIDSQDGHIYDVNFKNLRSWAAQGIHNKFKRSKIAQSKIGHALGIGDNNTMWGPNYERVLMQSEDGMSVQTVMRNVNTGETIPVDKYGRPADGSPLPEDAEMPGKYSNLGLIGTVRKATGEKISNALKFSWNRNAGSLQHRKDWAEHQRKRNERDQFRDDNGLFGGMTGGYYKKLAIQAYAKYANVSEDEAEDMLKDYMKRNEFKHNYRKAYEALMNEINVDDLEGGYGSLRDNFYSAKLRDLGINAKRLRFLGFKGRKKKGKEGYRSVDENGNAITAESYYKNLMARTGGNPNTDGEGTIIGEETDMTGKRRTVSDMFGNPIKWIKSKDGRWVEDPSDDDNKKAHVISNILTGNINMIGDKLSAIGTDIKDGLAHFFNIDTERDGVFKTLLKVGGGILGVLTAASAMPAAKAWWEDHIVPFVSNFYQGKILPRIQNIISPIAPAIGRLGVGIDMTIRRIPTAIETLGYKVKTFITEDLPRIWSEKIIPFYQGGFEFIGNTVEWLSENLLQGAINILPRVISGAVKGATKFLSKDIFTILAGIGRRDKDGIQSTVGTLATNTKGVSGSMKSAYNGMKTFHGASDLASFLTGRHYSPDDYGKNKKSVSEAELKNYYTKGGPYPDNSGLEPEWNETSEGDPFSMDTLDDYNKNRKTITYQDNLDNLAAQSESVALQGYSAPKALQLFRNPYTGTNETVKRSTNVKSAAKVAKSKNKNISKEHEMANIINGKKSGKGSRLGKYVGGASGLLSNIFGSSQDGDIDYTAGQNFAQSNVEATIDQVKGTYNPYGFYGTEDQDNAQQESLTEEIFGGENYNPELNPEYTDDPTEIKAALAVLGNVQNGSVDIGSATQALYIISQGSVNAFHKAQFGDGYTYAYYDTNNAMSSGSSANITMYGATVDPDTGLAYSQGNQSFIPNAFYDPEYDVFTTYPTQACLDKYPNIISDHNTALVEMYANGLEQGDGRDSLSNLMGRFYTEENADLAGLEPEEKKDYSSQTMPEAVMSNLSDSGSNIIDAYQNRNSIFTRFTGFNFVDRIRTGQTPTGLVRSLITGNTGLPKKFLKSVANPNLKKGPFKISRKIASYVAKPFDKAYGFANKHSLAGSKIGKLKGSRYLTNQNKILKKFNKNVAKETRKVINKKIDLKLINKQVKSGKASDKAIENIINNIKSETSGIEKSVQRSMEKKATMKGAFREAAANTGKKGGGFFKTFGSKLKTFFKEMFSKRTVKGVLTDAVGKGGDDAIIEALEKDAPDVLEKAMKKGLLKGSAKASVQVVPILNIVVDTATAVWDFTTGCKKAAEYMGVTEEQFENIWPGMSGLLRFIIGLANAVNGFITMGIVPMESVINFFVDIVAPVVGIDPATVMKAREESSKELAKFNKNSGTDFDITDYNTYQRYERGDLIEKIANWLPWGTTTSRVLNEYAEGLKRKTAEYIADTMKTSAKNLSNITQRQAEKAYNPTKVASVAQLTKNKDVGTDPYSQINKIKLAGSGSKLDLGNNDIYVGGGKSSNVYLNSSISDINYNTKSSLNDKVNRYIKPSKQNNPYYTGYRGSGTTITFTGGSSSSRIINNRYVNPYNEIYSGGSSNITPIDPFNYQYSSLGSISTLAAKSSSETPTIINKSYYGKGSGIAGKGSGASMSNIYNIYVGGASKKKNKGKKKDDTSSDSAAQQRSADIISEVSRAIMKVETNGNIAALELNEKTNLYILGMARWEGKDASKIIKAIFKKDAKGSETILGKALFKKLKTNNKLGKGDLTPANKKALKKLLATDQSRDVQVETISKDVKPIVDIAAKKFEDPQTAIFVSVLIWHYGTSKYEKYIPKKLDKKATLDEFYKAFMKTKAYKSNKYIFDKAYQMASTSTCNSTDTSNVDTDAISNGAGISNDVVNENAETNNAGTGNWITDLGTNISNAIYALFGIDMRSKSSNSDSSINGESENMNFDETIKTTEEDAETINQLSKQLALDIDNLDYTLLERISSMQEAWELSSMQSNVVDIFANSKLLNEYMLKSVWFLEWLKKQKDKAKPKIDTSSTNSTDDTTVPGTTKTSATVNSDTSTGTDSNLQDASNGNTVSGTGDSQVADNAANSTTGVEFTINAGSGTYNVIINDIIVEKIIKYKERIATKIIKEFKGFADNKKATSPSTDGSYSNLLRAFRAFIDVYIGSDKDAKKLEFFTKTIANHKKLKSNIDKLWNNRTKEIEYLEGYYGNGGAEGTRIYRDIKDGKFLSSLDKAIYSLGTALNVLEVEQSNDSIEGLSMKEAAWNEAMLAMTNILGVDNDSIQDMKRASGNTKDIIPPGMPSDVYNKLHDKKADDSIVPGGMPSDVYNKLYTQYSSEGDTVDKASNSFLSAFRDSYNNIKTDKSGKAISGAKNKHNHRINLINKALIAYPTVKDFDYMLYGDSKSTDLLKIYDKNIIKKYGSIINTTPNIKTTTGSGIELKKNIFEDTVKITPPKGMSAMDVSKEALAKELSNTSNRNNMYNASSVFNPYTMRRLVREKGFDLINKTPQGKYYSKIAEELINDYIYNHYDFEGDEDTSIASKNILTNDFVNDYGIKSFSDYYQAYVAANADKIMKKHKYFSKYLKFSSAGQVVFNDHKVYDNDHVKLDNKELPYKSYVFADALNQAWESANTIKNGIAGDEYFKYLGIPIDKLGKSKNKMLSKSELGKVSKPVSDDLKELLEFESRKMGVILNASNAKGKKAKAIDKAAFNIGDSTAYNSDSDITTYEIKDGVRSSLAKTLFPIRDKKYPDYKKIQELIDNNINIKSDAFNTDGITLGGLVAKDNEITGKVAAPEEQEKLEDSAKRIEKDNKDIDTKISELQKQYDDYTTQIKTKESEGSANNQKPTLEARKLKLDQDRVKSEIDKLNKTKETNSSDLKNTNNEINSTSSIENNPIHSVILDLIRRHGNFDATEIGADGHAAEKTKYNYDKFKDIDYKVGKHKGKNTVYYKDENGKKHWITSKNSYGYFSDGIDVDKVLSTKERKKLDRSYMHEIGLDDNKYHKIHDYIFDEDSESVEDHAKEIFDKTPAGIGKNFLIDTADTAVTAAKEFTGIGKGSKLIDRYYGAGTDPNFISQLDYKNAKFKDGESLAEAGCGPAVAAMAINGLYGGASMMEASALANKYKVNGGTDANYFRDIMGRAGATTTYYEGSKAKHGVTDALKKGQQAIILGQDSSNKSKANSPFGPGNHYVLAKGMGGGKVAINDPEQHGTKMYDKKILNNAKLGIAVGRGSKILDKAMYGKYAGGASKGLRHANLASWSEVSADELAKAVKKYHGGDCAIAKHAQDFIDAGTESKLDPRFLVALAAQEVGWDLNANKMGKANNVYDIGAFNSNPNNKLSLGKYANATKRDGIINGAKWIKNNYYNKGQTTVNLMSNDPGGHNFCVPGAGWISSIEKIMGRLPKNTKVSYETKSLNNDVMDIQGSNGTSSSSSSSGGSKGWQQELNEAIQQMTDAMLGKKGSTDGTTSSDGNFTSNGAWIDTCKAVHDAMKAHYGGKYNYGGKGCTITINGKKVSVPRNDCSGYVSAVVSAYTGKSFSGSSSTFASSNNATLSNAGFTFHKFTGWGDLKQGDIISQGGSHVEIFDHNADGAHYVWNYGSNKSASADGPVRDGGKHNYTAVWRPPAGKGSGLSSHDVITKIRGKKLIGGSSKMKLTSDAILGTANKRYERTKNANQFVAKGSNVVYDKSTPNIINRTIEKANKLYDTKDLVGGAAKTRAQTMSYKEYVKSNNLRAEMPSSQKSYRQYIRNVRKSTSTAKTLASASPSYKKIKKAGSMTAAAVLRVAAGEVGYLEKKSNKNLYSKKKNAADGTIKDNPNSNYTKYMLEIHGNPGGGPWAWCAAFVCWCFKKVDETKAKKALYGNYQVSVAALKTQFKNKNAYKKTPKVGDLIFFNHKKQENSSEDNHVGLVYKVTKNRVYTIEGNTSADPKMEREGTIVAKKSYSRKNPEIMGYGRPKYDKSTTDYVAAGSDIGFDDVIHVVNKSEANEKALNKLAKSNEAKRDKAIEKSESSAIKSVKKQINSLSGGSSKNVTFRDIYQSIPEDTYGGASKIMIDPETGESREFIDASAISAGAGYDHYSGGKSTNKTKGNKNKAITKSAAKPAAKKKSSNSTNVLIRTVITILRSINSNTKNNAEMVELLKKIAKNSGKGSGLSGGDSGTSSKSSSSGSSNKASKMHQVNEIARNADSIMNMPTDDQYSEVTDLINELVKLSVD